MAQMMKIEKFFLNTILLISIAGLTVVLAADLLAFPEDKLSIYISVALLVTNLIAYVVRNSSPNLAVILIGSVGLIGMSYQRLVVPHTTTTLAVVLIIGFIFSVMLKGKTMWIMHGITFIIINTVFVYLVDHKLTAAVAYSTLYVILTYATGVLKSSYDRMHRHLREKNEELDKKAKEIEAQNEELLIVQDNLSALNANLEKVVNERTAKIKLQNQVLIKYSYTNAHHLRGPVARLLGLAEIYKMENKENLTFYVEKMVEQAHEIDSVIKQINVDLAAQHLDVGGTGDH